MPKLLALIFSLALFLPVSLSAQPTTVADWEAGSVVLINGHKFIKLNPPGSDGYFMAMEPLCNLPTAADIQFTRLNNPTTDSNFTLSLPNVKGIGVQCSWTATTTSGSPVTPNWTTLPDTLSGLTTGCTIQIPQLTEDIIFTTTITGCNPTPLTLTKTMFYTIPETFSQVSDEYIDFLLPCTPDSCPTEATLELLDERDNKSYTTRKLPDNNLWMVDNLAYDPNNYCATRSTMANPNGSANYSNNFGPNTYGSCVNPAYGGSVCSTGTCGYLYNWQAAMQDATAYYNSNYTGSQENVAGLCPAGFILPTKNNFVDLDKAFGGTGINRNVAANDIVLSNWKNSEFYNGIFASYSNISGTLGHQGLFAYWWSSSQFNNFITYYMHLNYTNAIYVDQKSDSKNFGFAIRCIK